MNAWRRYPLTHQINTGVWLAELSQKYQRPVNLARLRQSRGCNHARAPAGHEKRELKEGHDRPTLPSLYQINTRVWLTELSRSLGRRATLDDIPDAELDRLAELGFDWIWFLSVWQTGPAAQAISRTNPEWRREFQETLPDLQEEDIAGSGFAITGYTRASRSRRRCGPGPPARAAATTRSEADARLRAQSHGAGSSLDRRSSGLFRPGSERRPGPRSAELHPGQTQERAADARLRPRSVLSPAGPTRCSSTTATRPCRRR